MQHIPTILNFHAARNAQLSRQYSLESRMLKFLTSATKVTRRHNYCNSSRTLLKSTFSPTKYHLLPRTVGRCGRSRSTSRDEMQAQLNCFPDPLNQLL